MTSGTPEIGEVVSRGSVRRRGMALKGARSRGSGRPRSTGSGGLGVGDELLNVRGQGVGGGGVARCSPVVGLVGGVVMAGVLARHFLMAPSGQGQPLIVHRQRKALVYTYSSGPCRV